jgi:Tol biopolymer transport system component
VWVHDLKTGKTQLASKANGSPGDRGAAYPTLSGDGRFVAFESTSTNFPGGDGSNSLVYVRDMKRGKLILVSKTNGGGFPAYGQIYGQVLSSDGRFAVFYSKDPDLPRGDGSTNHIYRRDLDTGHTALVDRTPNGHVANDRGSEPSISGSGRFVAFESYATNLPGGDGLEQVFLRDMRGGGTKLVSRNRAGHAQGTDAYLGHPSGNGRFVAFESDGSNLPGGDGSTAQIYVRDVRDRKTILLSRAGNGDPGNAYANYPSISLDGHWAAFYSGATNLGGNPLYANAFRAGPIG